MVEGFNKEAKYLKYQYHPKAPAGDILKGVRHPNILVYNMYSAVARYSSDFSLDQPFVHSITDVTCELYAMIYFLVYNLTESYSLHSLFPYSPAKSFLLV